MLSREKVSLTHYATWYPLTTLVIFIFAITSGLAGPIAERSKLSDLDHGQGDPGLNPSVGICFWVGDGKLSITSIYGYIMVRAYTKEFPDTLCGALEVVSLLPSKGRSP